MGIIIISMVKAQILVVLDSTQMVKVQLSAKEKGFNPLLKELLIVFSYAFSILLLIEVTFQYKNLQKYYLINHHL